MDSTASAGINEAEIAVSEEGEILRLEPWCQNVAPKVKFQKHVVECKSKTLHPRLGKKLKKSSVNANDFEFGRQCPQPLNLIIAGPNAAQIIRKP